MSNDGSIGEMPTDSPQLHKFVSTFCHTQLCSRVGFLSELLYTLLLCLAGSAAMILVCPLNISELLYFRYNLPFISGPMQ